MGKIIIEASSIQEALAMLQGTVSTATVYMANTGGGNVSNEDDDGGPADLNAPAVDKNGLPWDGRIHSSNRKLNGDGTWRGIRKTAGQPDAAAIAAVEAELRARVSGATVAMQPVLQMPPMTQPTAMQMPGPGVVMQMPPMTQPAAMQMQQPPAVQQVMQQPSQPAAIDFPALMRNIGQAFQTPGSSGGMLMTPEYLGQLTQYLQVSNISEVANDPNKIVMAANQMIADGRWLNV